MHTPAPQNDGPDFNATRTAHRSISCSPDFRLRDACKRLKAAVAIIILLRGAERRRWWWGQRLRRDAADGGACAPRAFCRLALTRSGLRQVSVNAL